MKHRYRLFIFLAILFYSCNEENGLTKLIIPTPEDSETTQFLSLAFSSPETAIRLRSSEAPDYTAESAIYSMEVLVFKPDGSLDGYGSVSRTEIAVSGKTYDKSYQKIHEVKDIPMTAGTRDLYVIANAPDNTFQNVTTKSQFLGIYESLDKQGLFLHPNATYTPNPSQPIGGNEALDWETNLTMFKAVENINFPENPSGDHYHYYIGYSHNEDTDYPTGIWKDSLAIGYVPIVYTDSIFELERMVARVAIKSIKFDLIGKVLDFGNGYPPTNLFSYELDSVFLVNAKILSGYSPNTSPSSNHFGYGNREGYNLLKNNYTLYSDGIYKNYLNEQIVPDIFGNYDIEDSNTPLWFYTFENNSSQYPTYFVLGVNYFFKTNTETMEVKYYYPVKVNSNNRSVIERNNQYRISIIIKGLGTNGSIPEIFTQRSALGNIPYELPIEVIDESGDNLFPWTGNIYE